MSRVEFCNSILEGRERCDLGPREKPIGLRLDLHSSCPLKNVLLCFKLIREDQVGVTQQAFINGYNIFTNVESSLVAHDRIEYYHFE